MKSLLELYTLLLKEFKETYNNHTEIAFICHSIGNLKVSTYERNFLLNHFISEKPSKTKHVAFYEHELFIHSKNPISFVLFKNYKNADLAYSLRVQLLTNIIANLKDGSN